jgi:bifunctional UDP-N-acetylglucosamine pyrophosphorylase/glucosamine-1-phosphate N-acetyltransferase
VLRRCATQHKQDSVIGTPFKAKKCKRSRDVTDCTDTGFSGFWRQARLLVFKLWQFRPINLTLSVIVTTLAPDSRLASFSNASGLNVVVLAAGQGKRMRSDLPKVLHPIAGQPLLGHVLATALGLNPLRLVVVVGHGGDQVRDWVSGAFPEPVRDGRLRFALQAAQLGTGHAVQQAVPDLDHAHPTLVLYGDVPLTRPETLSELIEAAAPMDGKATLGLLTASMPDPAGYGRIVRNALGAVQCIVEHKDATEAQRSINEINTGILVAPTGFLIDALAALRNNNAQGEYYLTDVIAAAVEADLDVATRQPATLAEIEGVNSKVQLAALERVHQRVLADALLEAGVTLADPGRIDIRGTLVCGRDVSIDVGCVFEGKVELADGVKVGPYAVLRDVSVAEGGRIEAFSHVNGTGARVHIGAGADIGPFARLRPGAVLGAGAHVGNFVEEKNATLGNGSKAGHLSYLGDATIGERVNIGAGTITCNYDGANKHRTVIEDDVFIGSDTTLVAPVTVKRGATLGASTCLTKDAPEAQLTVSRAKQVSLPNWQRPVKKPK